MDLQEFVLSEKINVYHQNLSKYFNLMSVSHKSRRKRRGSCAWGLNLGRELQT